ncbi:unnamed protein product [Gongylonema pulchrum]|uniref:BTB/POZ domain-containing protein n=1 Tax=Gongylonema pulchrum TaxID=637853 RepID=A0A183DL80_9BILA|nr:unnamed protein product [Gongylonema pulchrum]
MLATFGSDMCYHATDMLNNPKLHQVNIVFVELLVSRKSFSLCLSGTCDCWDATVPSERRQRPDTVRCIITYITGEKREELSKQLTQRRAAILDEEEMLGVNDEFIPGGEDNTGNISFFCFFDIKDYPIKQQRWTKRSEILSIGIVWIPKYSVMDLFSPHFRSVLLLFPDALVFSCFSKQWKSQKRKNQE